MSYIELINNFWELDETWQFSCCETRLYFYLLKTANRLGWENSWTHSDAKTSANVGVSVNSFKTARHRLAQSGLISFNSGGNGQGNKCKYQLRCQDRCQNLIPKPQPKPQPKLDSTLLNNIDKDKDKEISSNEDTKKCFENNWKNDFQIYLAETTLAFDLLKNDGNFIRDIEKFHPTADVKLSIEKSFMAYWSTEEGWKNKSARKETKAINWKSTILKNFEKNIVYKANAITNERNKKWF